MNKILLFATAAFLVTGVSFADTGKKKNKSKGKTCCSKDKKSCEKEKIKTGKI
ncbi:MAG: hypothetical protein WKI04_19525 [Ferruginibacter sp.]